MPADSAFYCMDKITIHTLTPFSQFPKFHSVRIWKCSGIYTYSCNGRRESARAASTKCLKNLSTVVEQDLPTGNTWWRYFVLLQQVQPICRPDPDYEITALASWRRQDLHQQLGIACRQTKRHIRRRVKIKEVRCQDWKN